MTKLFVKHTWSKKMTVLNPFLEVSLNLISNDIKYTTKSGKFKKKNGVKV